MIVGQEQIFLEQIGASFNDPMPRLIYADWLEENGYLESAKLLRNAVAHMTWKEEIPVPSTVEIDEIKALQEWQERLPIVYGNTWSLENGLPRWHIGSLTPIEELTESSLAFTFLFWCRQIPYQGASYSDPLNEFCESRFSSSTISLSHWFSVNPLASVNTMASCQNLSSLRSLDLTSCQIQALDLQMLMQSPHLQQLTHLNLTQNRLGNTGMDRLLRSDSFPQLISLDVSNNQIDPGSFRGRFDDPLLNRLLELNLSNNPLSEMLFAMFFQFGKPLALRSLILSRNKISFVRWETNIKEGTLPHLRRLDLSDNPNMLLGREFPNLARLFPKLKRLSLRNTMVSPDFIATLARQDAPPTLRQLDLGKSNLHDDHIFQMVQLDYLHQLHQLDLSDNPIEENGVMAIFTDAFARLESLSLARIPLQARPIRHLLRSPQFQNLKMLDLSSSLTTKNGILTFLKQFEKHNLYSLKLRGNRLNNSILDPLLNNPALLTLHHLDLRENLFKEDAKQKIRERFQGQVRIEL